MSRTFAIDYDGTWTADPEAFQAFANLLRRRGHRVIVVTAREHCRAQGETVHVWVDDNPEMVGPDVVLVGAGRRSS